MQSREERIDLACRECAKYMLLAGMITPPEFDNAVEGLHNVELAELLSLMICSRHIFEDKSYNVDYIIIGVC